MQAKSSVVGQGVKITLNNLKRSHIEDIHCNPLHGKSWLNDFLTRVFFGDLIFRVSIASQRWQMTPNKKIVGLIIRSTDLAHIRERLLVKKIDKHKHTITQTQKHRNTQTHRVPTRKQRQPTSGYNWKPRSRYKLFISSSPRGVIDLVSSVSLLSRLNLYKYKKIHKNNYKTHQSINKMRSPSLITRLTDWAPTEEGER